MLTHQQMRTQALADAAVKAEFLLGILWILLVGEFLKARSSQGLTQAACSASIELIGADG